MAITLRNIGAGWAIVTADAAVPLIGGGIVADDRVYICAAWKAFGTTAQITSPAGWTEVTEFADGAVAAGANVGSVKVGAWWKDWAGDGSETDPTLDFSVAPAPAAICPIVFTKAVDETWNSPLFEAAAIAAAINWTATAPNQVLIDTGDAVICLVGFRDDSATMTRSTTTGIAATGVSWGTNYTEEPAAHASTTTSNDISADLGYRMVGANGPANVTFTAAGTLAASETGSALWIVQGVTPIPPADPTLHQTKPIIIPSQAIQDRSRW